jgi:hypothetical protein
MLMDKKAKKRLQIVNGRLQTLRQQLAGARQQADDPEEIRTLERQVAEAEMEVARLKES